MFNNPVGCLSNLAISRLTATKLRYVNGSCSITEVIKQLQYKINDAYFLYFWFGLNIRDHNKPYDEKGNIDRPYYYLEEGSETEVVLNDSGRGIKYRRVRSDGSKYEYWNEP